MILMLSILQLLAKITEIGCVIGIAWLERFYPVYKQLH